MVKHSWRESKRDWQRRAGRVLVVAAGLFSAGLPIASSAQDRSNDDELAAKATDPTASLMSFQLNDWYTANFHGIDDSANQVVFRAAIPFALGSTNHIFRDHANRISRRRRRARPASPTRRSSTWWCSTSRGGAGASGSRARCRPGRTGSRTDKWTLGPAFGFVNSSDKQINWGLFAQTFFSFAGEGSAPDVGLINLQPIFSYQLGGGRSLSFGNSALVYDTENSRWASLMLGVELRAGGDLRRPQVAPELRGRLRLPRRPRQPQVDGPRRNRAAVADSIEHQTRRSRPVTLGARL